MANEMLWSGQKGVLTNTKLNKAYRRVAQPLFKFRQFCDIKNAFGKNAGEAVNWLKVSNLGSYGGQLTETNTMFEATQPLLWGSATVQEYGNSIPWTFKTEALSQFDINEILRSGLVDDMAKVIEGLVEREFSDTPLKASPITSASLQVKTNGTATATATGDLTSHHIRKMVLELKKRNVPGYTKLGGQYAGILSAGAVDSIRGDLVEGYGNSSFLGSNQGANIFLNGQVGEVHGVRIVEDTWGTMFAYDATGRTATSKAASTTSRTTKNLTIATSWTGMTESLDSYIFGSPTVAEIIACPEEIRKKIPTDYGRSKGLAWYAILAFKLFWDVESGLSEESNARIVHFTAA